MNVAAEIRKKTPRFFFIFAALAAVSFVLHFLLPEKWLITLNENSGMTVPQLAALVFGVLALSELAVLFTQFIISRKNKPAVEALMIGRLYHLAAILVIGLCVAAGFDALKAIGSFFALFGGMLLGWSLQAPVSGFAAYLLVSVKRPFRPGDRVQFPNLGLTGDVKENGPMYTILDQVGGSIGSEEAVGRHILVPNALLFSQVVINYTVTQEAAYMLDEVVIRITFDSDWEAAEKILKSAATAVTGDIIAATGVRPYIRSDLYDYGVYLRLRYQTAVKDRVEIQYRITKKIFQEIQNAHAVDLAIPFVYSYKKGVDKQSLTADKEVRSIREIAIESVKPMSPAPESQDIEQLAQSIAEHGLLQPVLLVKKPNDPKYDILAGHARFEACKSLGWKSVPAIVRLESAGEGLDGGVAPSPAP